MRRSASQRIRPSSGGATLGWGAALICIALIAFGLLGYFYFTVPQKPKLDQASLCPASGPQGITVVLVDTTDDLPKTTQRQVLGMLEDQIANLPPYHKLDVRVLDVTASRSLSL